VLAENRSEHRVAGNIRTCASGFQVRDDASEGECSSQCFSSIRKLEVPVAFEVPVASLAILVPARTLHSPTADIGTELVAHREKIEVTRRGSPFERSPVPMDRAHRP
jgi:hypothetical protein